MFPCAAVQDSYWILTRVNILKAFWVMKLQVLFLSTSYCYFILRSKKWLENTRREDEDKHEVISAVWPFIVQLQKISILHPPTEGFCFAPPSPPRNSSLFSYISSKNLAFKTPLPPGISNDLPWGGYGFFLEPHIMILSKNDHQNPTLVSSMHSFWFMSFKYFFGTPSSPNNWWVTVNLKWGPYFLYMYIKTSRLFKLVFITVTVSFLTGKSDTNLIGTFCKSDLGR